MRERVVAGEVLPPFMAALAFMHANSIVHRDIKPENILLMADRAIKVGVCSRADAGLAPIHGRPARQHGVACISMVLLCRPAHTALPSAASALIPTHAIHCSRWPILG